MPANIYKNKDGQRVPGVTTVIGSNLGWGKNQLMYWAWKEGIEGRDYKETRDRAADVGTMAHAMIEADIKGIDNPIVHVANQYFTDPNVDESMLQKAENGFAAWLEWKELFKFNPLFAEKLLVSEAHQFGGQIDIAAVQNNTSIIDIKTSNNIYAAHKIQLAAYQQLWDENFPDDPCRNVYLLQISKDNADFAYHSYSDLSGAWEVFKHLRAIHGKEKQL